MVQNFALSVSIARPVVDWNAAEREYPVIEIRPVTPLNILTFKAVRLHALCDTSSAFGSTYAREAQLSDSEWHARVERMNGQGGVGFLALDGEMACGIAGAFLDQYDPARAQLVSMWTAPTHRQQGIGRLLVEEVLEWAHRRNADTMLLMVTNNNQPAIAFYERLGFTKTGRIEPYPNDPTVLELEMSRTIFPSPRRR